MPYQAHQMHQTMVNYFLIFIQLFMLNESSLFILENPPTYEEAMQLSEAAGTEFRPVYPVFKRSTSYSSGTSI